MLKILFCLLAFSALHADFKEYPPAALNHPVSTQNREAQEYFNIGLTNVYAYNHEFAFKMFKKAAELDPTLAMAYWGMALSLGQNINVDITPEKEIQAYDLIQNALTLRATPVEENYIKALAARYSNEAKPDYIALRHHYADTMKALSEKYPQDLDAACLYAESLMCINPWIYWTREGKPEAGTLDAIAVLDSILRRNPNHLGANHYNIHAWEESTTPERALLSAFRLTNLYPYGGHLLHMPCHIFNLCGNYNDAIITSYKAIEQDWKFIKDNGITDYPIHYLPHNYRVLARTFLLQGDYASAMKAANDMEQLISPYMKERPNLEDNLIVPVEINLYFKEWQKLADIRTPDVKDPFTRAYYHFGRAMGNIELGNTVGYQSERASMNQLQQKIAPDQMNYQLLNLASLLLDAEEKKANPSEYISRLEKAVHIQDNLDYGEPPLWYLPLRAQLGEAYLETKDFVKAEAAFTKGLQEYQRNPRFLKGLYESLKGQGKEWDASWVNSEYQAQVSK